MTDERTDDGTEGRTLYVDALRDDEREPCARTLGDARTHGTHGTVGDAGADPTPRLAGDGTPGPDESNRDVLSSATRALHPALVNPDLSPTLPALQAESAYLIASATAAALRAPDFAAIMERELRLDPLKFLATVGRFLGTDGKTSPSVVLNNIITAIPRGPLDALPEGFRRN